MGSALVWSTRANALTLVRLLLAPALAISILQRSPGVAAGIFALAVVTDLADGWVARRYGETSAFGAFADHAADAVFVTVGSAALACEGVLTPLLPWLIALAFTQYVLDSPARASVGLRRSSLGRWNGIAYYAIVAIPILRDALGLALPSDAMIGVGAWLLVASTLLSMGDRLASWLRERA